MENLIFLIKKKIKFSELRNIINSFTTLKMNVLETNPRSKYNYKS